MRTPRHEVSLEAGIYAEGTPYSGEYLARAYNEYADDVTANDQTPDDFQRWIESAFPSCCKPKG